MDTDARRLSERIDAEFENSRNALRNLRQQHVNEHGARQERFVLFEQSCERLPEIWTPRLNVLKQRLSERLKVPVLVQSDRRQAAVSFSSSLARVRMTFKALANADVSALVLDGALDIVPSLMPGPRTERLEQPFSQIDARSIGEWIENRIVDFVRTYLTLYESDYNLSGHIVEDPVTRIRFPKYAAATTLERDGKTLYFMNFDTRENFEEKATSPLQGAQKL